jgi:hypothetical protein
MSATEKKSRRDHVFVLTPEEKRTIAFVLCAVVLGVATKHYRDTHPRPARPLTVKEQRAAKKAARLLLASPPPTPSISAEK